MSLPTQQPAMMQTSAPLPANGAVQPLQAIKKHQPLMDLDCHRLRHLDPERPFSGMRDAVERLLPFHVRALQVPAQERMPEQYMLALTVSAGQAVCAALGLAASPRGQASVHNWPPSASCQRCNVGIGFATPWDMPMMHPQVFASSDAGEADAAQAAAENLQLTSGRRDAWDRQQAQAAFELSERIEKLQGQVRRWATP